MPTKSTYFSSEAITHLQMMDEILEFAMKGGRIVGAGMFDKNFKVVNMINLFVMAVTALTFIINIYDIYIFRKDTIRCAFCLLTCSAAVQGFVNFYTFIWNNNDIFSLKKKTEKFHENYSSIKASKIFEEQFMIVAHVVVGLTILLIATFILITFYPVVYYFITNERILHFGIELPFIDWESSWIGYGINFVHQAYCVFTTFCALIFCLSVIICYIASGICQYDVMNILLEELNELAIGNENGKNNEEISNKIKFLVETHVNLIEFLDETRRAFSPFFFFDFGALIFQKTVELFAIISVSF
jgi:hypothetical protein